jgi:hypothetical protein
MLGGRSRALAAICAAALLSLTAGCGGGGDSTESAPTNQSPQRAAEIDVVPARPAESVAEARCPVGSPGCRSAEGRIVYIERHDPDGDGDAHFVILDPQGITSRGLTAIDVRAGLRPHPLPEVGDLVSAAGPVQTGSFGQSQIHAMVLHVGSSA